jgi:diguanylate cyclase (GGDEF)-like protein
VAATDELVSQRGATMVDKALDRALGLWRSYDAVGRQVSRRDRRAVITAHLQALLFVAVAVALAWRSPLPTPQSVAELAALLALYVAAYRFEFQAEAGSMVPTQPVLVAFLAVGPLGLVPLLVLAGIMIGGLGRESEALGAYGWSINVVSAWHAMGPVVVLLLAGVSQPAWSDWPWLVAALVAQFLVDAVSAAVRMASVGVPLRTLVGPLGWTFRIDALMAVIGAGLVFCDGRPSWLQVGLVAVPVVLVRMLGLDRSRHVDVALSLGAALESASADAVLDPLTGLGNRRLWEQEVAEVDARLRGRPDLPVAVVVADIDGLKQANDTFGHAVGDRLLVQFADVLRAVAPAGSVTARLGGDEFAVLLAGDAARGDEAFLDRLRATVRACPPIGDTSLSVSAGRATCPPEATVEDAVRRADEAARREKQRRGVARREGRPAAAPGGGPQPTESDAPAVIR